MNNKLQNYIEHLKTDSRVHITSPEDVQTLIKIVEMAIQTLTSIAAEKCKPSFDSVLKDLERGKLISIIDTDTALSRQFLQDAANLISDNGDFK